MRWFLSVFVGLILFIVVGGPAPAQTDAAATAEELAQGERLYNIHCRACHLPRGKSRIKKLNLSDDEWNHGNQLEDIVQVVSEGIEATQMQAFQNRMKPEEIEAVAKYVLSFSRTQESGR